MSRKLFLSRRQIHFISGAVIILMSLFSSGPFLSAATAAECVFSSSIVGDKTVDLVTTPGACSLSILAGTSSLKIEAWGGGGGSMGQDNSKGAGGGGAYASSEINLNGNLTLYVLVGAGGVGSQSVGTSGGNSWAGLTNTAPSSSATGALASGGAGSGVTSPNNSNQLSGSIGTTIYVGGAGGSGAEGGGGGAASPAGNGVNGAIGLGGSGGSSPSAGIGGSAGVTSRNGGDGTSNVLGGGGGGGSYNHRGGMGGSPGGAGGAGYSTASTNPTSGVNTNSLGYGGNGGRGQIQVTRITNSQPVLTAEQIAALKAAELRAELQAAAEARALAIALAQATLAKTLKSDNPGSLSEYRAANIYFALNTSLARINSEVLKMPSADRSDFEKIRKLVDKIEFDETFFNQSNRPTVGTYAKNGVIVTDRTLATVNAKILELPIEMRADTTSIAVIAKFESFIDRVANTETRRTVTSKDLIVKGLLPAESIYRSSVIRGLSSYSEESLNSMAKIESAIKEQITKAEAPKLRLAAIKEKIAARGK